MNLPSVLLRAQCSPLWSPRLLRCREIFKRAYATHRDADVLSQTLDTKHRPNAKVHDTVGPFTLGVSQGSLRSGEKVKKWSELNTSGKVKRTAARTSNLTVILLGAGLSVLLAYSLTSELFSKNSPTVLYGDACERIKASAKVAKYLNSPLSFHNNPPSAIRPRHRNRHVISQIMVDRNGQEYMIMTFYVQGSAPGTHSVSPEASYFDMASDWVKDRTAVISEMTLEESQKWAEERAQRLWDRTKQLFRYLSGSPMPPPPLPSYPDAKTKPEESTGWSFAGMFGSLRGTKGGSSQGTNTDADGRTFTDGEVHAQFVRDKDGYFVYRYLLIDIPTSNSRTPIRVFVERAPGVRENEPVMRWKPDS